MIMDNFRDKKNEAGSGTISGNVYDKYHSKNPIARHLMNNFLKTFDAHLRRIRPQKCLEVGCGEGYLLSHIDQLFPGTYLEGIDFSQEIIDFARLKNPDVYFKQASVLDLPYESDAFDLVIACEVLEHVDAYTKALSEIQRVGNTHFIFSVPQEPVWRYLNMTRLKYVGQFGNTPGHLNHWSKKAFLRLIEPYFKIEFELSPFPWTMVSCSQKS